jgi:hypothetical protein
MSGLSQPRRIGTLQIRLQSGVAAPQQEGFGPARGPSDGDFMVLTCQQRGRRVVPSDPGRSLMLTKPTGGVPHKGGMRFGTDSLEYRVLSQWIAAGAPQPDSSDARIEKLEIVPAAVVVKSPSTQQLLVRARFTDGHWEDVTGWTKYTSANESVA